jgi:hypothetical protein
MGTNFYLAKRPCKECGLEPEEIHLGKRSGGWRFLVQGHIWNEALGSEIRSCKEMIAVARAMCEKGWLIRDEYGEEYAVQEFKEVLEQTKTWRGEPAKCHYTECKKSGYVTNDDKLDEEDWTVIFREFS